MEMSEEEKKDYDKLLEDIKPLAEGIASLYNQALALYTPAVNEICSRIAPLKEVEHLLDWLLGYACDDHFLELYKQVLRHYVYPESVHSYVMGYYEMWEPEKLGIKNDDDEDE